MEDVEWDCKYCSGSLCPGCGWCPTCDGCHCDSDTDKLEDKPKSKEIFRANYVNWLRKSHPLEVLVVVS